MPQVFEITKMRIAILLFLGRLFTFSGNKIKDQNRAGRYTTEKLKKAIFVIPVSILRKNRLTDIP